MKNTKRIIAAVMALAMVSALAPVSAIAEEPPKTTTLSLTKANPYDELYVLTIPADATITETGWTALQALNVKYNGSKSFDPAKKITVTAESANSWELKSGDATNTSAIGYTLKSESTDTEATTAWEFSADEVNKKDASEAVVGTSKPIGIDVSADDYAAATADTYTDTITFTVAVESAVTSYVPRLCDRNSDGNYLVSSFYDGTNVNFEALSKEEAQALAANLSENPAGRPVRLVFEIWPDNNKFVNTVGPDGTTTQFSLNTNNYTSVYTLYYVPKQS